MSGIRVALPAGEVEVSAAFESPDEPWAAVAIAHGAGAGMDHPFLAGLAAGLVEAGIAALRFTFPYREAGRRMPGPAPHAIATWGAALADLAERAPELPRFAAGKSYGGRMASTAAAASTISPAGLVYLGYPLHPPGEPAKARTAHLPHVVPPQLFVAGTGDPFIHPLTQLEEAVASCQDAEIAWITGGGHSFEIKGAKRPADEVGAGLAPLLAEWMRGVIQRPVA
ncbi:dienelactone hydrolase [Microbacterium saccharophilum]|uniref:Dienelactone hydrolase n=1 Tax=Microbacterium saccharophilum TaxID=1213358 RepID=A0A5C8I8F9_9MICO|nr:alpha/beta family hydrolase [Microbacterium saccharophilum]TXK14173.1 dienelactone hydrolase [Microbacterium saccharophilum]GEP46729.1 alpha/beta hydrolase [Microbacterium saccharophilum]